MPKGGETVRQRQAVKESPASTASAWTVTRRPSRADRVLATGALAGIGETQLSAGVRAFRAEGGRRLSVAGDRITG